MEGECYETARNFITLGNQRKRRKTLLFIDGLLDEIRSGQSDRREPFGKIRAKLESLGGDAGQAGHHPRADGEDTPRPR